MSTNPLILNERLLPATAHPWWRGAVIYQVYPRSFQDSNGDGIGDLQGIISRLDHVASLGVDAVWISPFYTSPMRDFGYDVADYCGVDPVFGTLADFDDLVAHAHALGLRVLIDQVYAHTSDLHPWFAESRASPDNAKADWFVWADAKSDGSPPNNWQSVFGGPAWTWDARRCQYYMHNFLPEQPQLNGHHPEVQDALLSVAQFWLDRGVDGFRVDAINFMMHNPALTDNPPALADDKPRTRPFDFQQHIHNQSQPEIPAFIRRLRGLMDKYDVVFTVAEVGGAESDGEMKAFTANNAHFSSAYGFDYLYADRLTPALVKSASEGWPAQQGIGWPSWALANHDAPRWISRWAPGVDRPDDRIAYARAVLLFFMSQRGNAILWQGEELGLSQVDIPFALLQDPEAIRNWPLTLSRDGSRTPMPWTSGAAHHGFTSGTPWLPFGADHAALAVDLQEADPASLLHWTRAVIALRDAEPLLKWGDMSVLATTGDVLVFERTDGTAAMLCAFNFGETAADWPVTMPIGGIVRIATGGATQNHLPARSGIIIERSV